MTMLLHNKRTIARTCLALAAAFLLAGNVGCLNPAFINQVSNGSVVPTAPGDTPFVHVLVINATQELTASVLFGWTPDFQGYNSAGVIVFPEQQQGFLLACPVNQIGLGDPSNLITPAIILTTATGTEIDVPASAFPLVVAQGRDFRCGDTVVFTILDDSSSGYGIRILPGRVDGSTQQGPFSGPDTFEIVQLLLMSSGRPPTVVP